MTVPERTAGLRSYKTAESRSRGMDVGIVFPQTEIGTDPAVLAEYARRTEALGFDHLLAYDHVLGVDPDREGWEGAYTNADGFHEPMTLFSHLAAVTDRVEFVTGVLVLPQRQPTLVAKQAAEVDLVSGERFRLGAGVGWNEDEAEAMGTDFSTRGRRIEEAIDLLRALWTEPIVEFDGEFYSVEGLGINPLPDREIPLWIGGAADPVLDRIARTGDGWLPYGGRPGDLEERFERLGEFADEHDRDADDIGIHARVSVDPTGDPDDWADAVAEWAAFGADYLAPDPMGADLSPNDHVAWLGEFADALDDRGLR